MRKTTYGIINASECHLHCEVMILTSVLEEWREEVKAKKWGEPKSALCADEQKAIDEVDTCIATIQIAAEQLAEFLNGRGKDLTHFDKYPIGG